jgi:hypothetical protein
MRKASLSRLLARRVDGIFLSEFEQGEIGPDLFRHACLMGLEGPGVETSRPAVSRRPVARSRTGSIRRSAEVRISSAEAAGSAIRRCQFPFVA